MPENLIKKIRTSEGDLQIDYNALANLPDLSSVGAQADWNENDPDSSSYIKNKTHYTDANGTVYRLDSKYMPLGVVTNVAVSNITGGHRLTLTTNNGTKTINIMDGTIGKDGAQGVDGAPGKDGVDGVDGITPHIGENGNWWLGEEDTGTSAFGLQANANWNQTDSEAVDYIKNKPALTKYSLKLIDSENGFQYTIKMANGNITSFCAPGSIAVTTQPDKLEYMQGQRFDPTGMVVSVMNTDGTTSELTDYTFSDEPMMEVGEGVEFEITYNDGDSDFSTFVTLDVTEFDPAVELIDFGYTANADGTYTLTSWKGTTGGVTGTELIVPDNALVIL